MADNPLYPLNPTAPYSPEPAEGEQPTQPGTPQLPEFKPQGFADLYRKAVAEHYGLPYQPVQAPIDFSQFKALAQQQAPPQQTQFQPAQQQLQQPLKDEGYSWSDPLKVMAKGVGTQIVSPLGWLGGEASKVLTGQDYLQGVEDFGQRVGEYWQEEKSSALKEAEEKGIFGEGATIGQRAAAIGSMVGESIPGIAGGMGVGAGIAKGAAAAKALAGAGQLGTKGAAASYLTGEAAMAGGMMGAQQYQEIMQLPDDKLKNSEQYKLYLKQGMTPEEARKATADTVAQFAAAVSVPLTMAGGALGSLGASFINNKAGGQIANILAGRGGNATQRLGNVAAGAVEEAAQEALQSGGETIAGNLATQQYIDPNQALLEGLGEQMLTGAIAGGVMGGGMGAFARVRPEEQNPMPTLDNQAPEQQPVPQAETPDMAQDSAQQTAENAGVVPPAIAQPGAADEDIEMPAPAVSQEQAEAEAKTQQEAEIKESAKAFRASVPNLSDPKDKSADAKVARDLSRDFMKQSIGKKNRPLENADEKLLLLALGANKKTSATYKSIFDELENKAIDRAEAGQDAMPYDAHLLNSQTAKKKLNAKIEAQQQEAAKEEKAQRKYRPFAPALNNGLIEDEGTDITPLFDYGLTLGNGDPAALRGLADSVRKFVANEGNPAKRDSTILSLTGTDNQRTGATLGKASVASGIRETIKRNPDYVADMLDAYAETLSAKAGLDEMQGITESDYSDTAGYDAMFEPGPDINAMAKQLDDMSPQFQDGNRKGKRKLGTAIVEDMSSQGESDEDIARTIQEYTTLEELRQQAESFSPDVAEAIMNTQFEGTDDMTPTQETISALQEYIESQTITPAQRDPETGEETGSELASFADDDGIESVFMLADLAEDAGQTDMFGGQKEAVKQAIDNKTGQYLMFGDDSASAAPAGLVLKPRNKTGYANETQASNALKAAIRNGVIPQADAANWSNVPVMVGNQVAGYRVERTGKKADAATGTQGTPATLDFIRPKTRAGEKGFYKTANSANAARRKLKSLEGQRDKWEAYELSPGQFVLKRIDASLPVKTQSNKKTEQQQTVAPKQEEITATQSNNSQAKQAEVEDNKRKLAEAMARKEAEKAEEKNAFDIYKQIKAEHKDEIVFVRDADFYSTFDEDAKEVSDYGLLSKHTIGVAGQKTQIASFPRETAFDYADEIANTLDKNVFVYGTTARGKWAGETISPDENKIDFIARKKIIEALSNDKNINEKTSLEYVKNKINDEIKKHEESSLYDAWTQKGNRDNSQLQNSIAFAFLTHALSKRLNDKSIQATQAKQAQQPTTLDIKQAQALVQPIQDKLADVVDIEIVNTVEEMKDKVGFKPYLTDDGDIPDATRKRFRGGALKSHETGTGKGKIYIVLDKIVPRGGRTQQEEIKSVLAHELVHVGIGEIFNANDAKIKAFRKDLFNKLTRGEADAKILKIFGDVSKGYKDRLQDANIDLSAMGEETLAKYGNQFWNEFLNEIAKDPAPANSALLDRIIQAVKNFVDDLFGTGVITEAQVRKALLTTARQLVNKQRIKALQDAREAKRQAQPTYAGQVQNRMETPQQGGTVGADALAQRQVDDVARARERAQKQEPKTLAQQWADMPVKSRQRLIAEAGWTAPGGNGISREGVGISQKDWAQLDDSVQNALSKYYDSTLPPEGVTLNEARAKANALRSQLENYNDDNPAPGIDAPEQDRLKWSIARDELRLEFLKADNIANRLERDDWAGRQYKTAGDKTVKVFDKEDPTDEYGKNKRVDSINENRRRSNIKFLEESIADNIERIRKLEQSLPNDRYRYEELTRPAPDQQAQKDFDPLALLLGGQEAADNFYQELEKTQAESAKAQPAPPAKQYSYFDIDSFNDMMKRMSLGDVSIEEHQSMVDVVSSQEAQIKAYFDKNFTKPKLVSILKHGGRHSWSSDKKGDLVNSVYGMILDQMLPYSSNTYTIGAGGSMADQRLQKLRGVTQQDLQDYADRRAQYRKEREELKARIADPKTLEDFQEAKDYGRFDTLPQEKLDLYRRLKAEKEAEDNRAKLDAEMKRREEEQAKAAAQANIPAGEPGSIPAGLDVGGVEIRQSYHKKKGTTIWIAKARNRVDYTTGFKGVLEPTAKKHNGAYSKFAKWPGTNQGSFWFESEADAKAFAAEFEPVPAAVTQSATTPAQQDDEGDTISLRDADEVYEGKVANELAALDDRYSVDEYGSIKFTGPSNGNTFNGEPVPTWYSIQRKAGFFVIEKGWDDVAKVMETRTPAKDAENIHAEMVKVAGLEQQTQQATQETTEAADEYSPYDGTTSIDLLNKHIDELNQYRSPRDKFNSITQMVIEKDQAKGGGAEQWLVTRNAGDEDNRVLIVRTGASTFQARSKNGQSRPGIDFIDAVMWADNILPKTTLTDEKIAEYKRRDEEKRQEQERLNQWEPYVDVDDDLASETNVGKLASQARKLYTPNDFNAVLNDVREYQYQQGKTSPYPTASDYAAMIRRFKAEQQSSNISKLADKVAEKNPEKGTILKDKAEQLAPQPTRDNENYFIPVMTPDTGRNYVLYNPAAGTVSAEQGSFKEIKELADAKNNQAFGNGPSYIEGITVRGKKVEALTNDRTRNNQPSPETLAGESPAVDSGIAAAGRGLAEGSRSSGEIDATGNGRANAGRNDRGGSVASQPGTVRADRPANSVAVTHVPKPESDQPADDTPKAASAKETNYRITEDDRLGQGTRGEKIRDNLEAIRIIKQLDAEGRNATPDEKKKLARYVGWGGLKQAFDPTTKDKAALKAGQELKALLTESEWKAAYDSILNAHYTSQDVIGAMYDIVRHFGFDGGRVLEPTVGTGNFIGLMPDDMARHSKWYASELDTITSKIAAQLYPRANVLTSTGFQEAEFPYGKFDLAIGNPPFGDERITDNNKHRQDINRMKIHNYVIAKSGKHLKPNGVMAMVVTSRFLDAKNPEARSHLAKDFDFLGAIRLPNTSFKAGAGTEVTTDIVFMRRRMDGDPEGNQDWLETGATMTNVRGEEVTVNKYFANRPHMMLGIPSMQGTMYGGNRGKEFTLETDPAIDIKDAIDQIINTGELAQFKDVAKKNSAQAEDVAAVEIEMNRKDVSIGGYVLENDRVYRREDDDADGNTVFAELTPDTQWTEKQTLGETRLERIKGMLELRELTYDLIRAERADVDQNILENKRTVLNQTYDDFTGKYGYINDPANSGLMSEDVKVEFGLEANYRRAVGAGKAKALGIEPIPSKATKAAILQQRVFYPHREITAAETPYDGYMVSLTEKGKLDLDYIAELTDSTREDVIRELSTGDKPLIFQDPDSKEWIQEDEYLSGNVKAKFKAVDGLPGYEKNAKALKAAFPADLEADAIHVEFGATWIPPETYREFLEELGINGARVFISQETGSVRITNKPDEIPNDLSATLQNEDYPIAEIFNTLANKRPLIAYDTIRKPDGGYTRKANAERTQELAPIAKGFKQIWADWVFSDDARRNMLATRYNELMNTNVDRKWNGELLRTVGANPAVVLRTTQNNAAWRMIQSPTTLLDHVVGAGKTFTVITGIMERKRLGFSKKPMVIVPNHLVSQWAKDFMLLYPGANILAPTEKDFTPANRRRLFARIATGDYDAVIIGHSQLKKMAMNPQTEAAFIEKELDHLYKAQSQAEENDDKRTARTIANRIAKRKERIKSLQNIQRDDTVEFEDMGIDYITVDESHEFKNLEYATGMQNVVGMGDPKGSQKAFDLYMKLRHVLGNGGGAAFATGTPVSNSMVEMYSILRYLNPEGLKARGLDAFDAWAKAHAEIDSRDEITATQKIKTRTVMASFQNLPELLQLYGEFADSVTMKDLKAAYAEQIRQRNKEIGKLSKLGFNKKPFKPEREEFPVPKVKGGGRQLEVAKPNDAQKEYMDYLVTRAEKIEEAMKSGNFDPSQDNLLWVMSDARKMALDIRIVDPTAGDDPNNKVNRAAKNIKANYDKWAKDKGTQLVFCDLSTPKKNADKDAKVLINEALEKAGMKKDERTAKVLDALTWQEKWDYITGKVDAEIESGAIADDKADRWNDWVDKLDRSRMAALSTADSGFSVYDDLKAKLVAQGIPENEIRFIHDANTNQQKEELFAMVNEGAIRVLIGSSAKMGPGMNVQKRLVALHHLDAPWRPADVEQREGRIIRQGNDLYMRDPDKFNVDIRAYSTSNTFDAVMWQILARKAEMLEQFRSGARTITEENTDSASYSEFMAESTGNPAYKERHKLTAEITELEGMKRRTAMLTSSAKRTINQAEQTEANINSALSALENDLSVYGDTLKTADYNGNVYKFDIGSVLNAEQKRFKQAEAEHVKKLEAHADALLEWESKPEEERGAQPKPPGKPTFPGVMSGKLIAKSEWLQFVHSLLNDARDKGEAEAMVNGLPLNVVCEFTKDNGGTYEYTVHYGKSNMHLTTRGSTSKTNGPTALVEQLSNFGGVDTYRQNLQRNYRLTESRKEKHVENVKVAQSTLNKLAWTNAQETELQLKKERLKEVTDEINNLEEKLSEERAKGNKYIDGADVAAQKRAAVEAEQNDPNRKAQEIANKGFFRQGKNKDGSLSFEYIPKAKDITKKLGDNTKGETFFIYKGQDGWYEVYQIVHTGTGLRIAADEKQKDAIADAIDKLANHDIHELIKDKVAITPEHKLEAAKQYVEENPEMLADLDDAPDTDRRTEAVRRTQERQEQPGRRAHDRTLADEMNIDEIRKAYLDSPVIAGARGEQAYLDDLERWRRGQGVLKNTQATVLAQNMAFVNDFGGHHLGDLILFETGKAFQKAGADFYHIRGDTYAAQADDPQTLNSNINRIAVALAEQVAANPLEGEKNGAKWLLHELDITAGINSLDEGSLAENPLEARMSAEARVKADVDRQRTAGKRPDRGFKNALFNPVELVTFADGDQVKIFGSPEAIDHALRQGGITEGAEGVAGATTDKMRGGGYAFPKEAENRLRFALTRAKRQFQRNGNGGPFSYDIDPRNTVRDSLLDRIAELDPQRADAMRVWADESSKPTIDILTTLNVELAKAKARQPFIQQPLPPAEDLPVKPPVNAKKTADEMSIDELRETYQRSYINPVLKGNNAYKDALERWRRGERGAGSIRNAVASGDVNNLGPVNNIGGNVLGDLLLSKMADAYAAAMEVPRFKAAGFEVFHLHGDEYVGHADDEGILREAMEYANELGRQMMFAGERNGHVWVVSGVDAGFDTHVIGRDGATTPEAAVKIADDKLNDRKTWERQNDLKPQKGVKPANFNPSALTLTGETITGTPEFIQAALKDGGMTEAQVAQLDILDKRVGLSVPKHLQGKVAAALAKAQEPMQWLDSIVGNVPFKYRLAFPGYVDNTLDYEFAVNRFKAWQSANAEQREVLKNAIRQGFSTGTTGGFPTGPAGKKNTRPAPGSNATPNANSGRQADTLRQQRGGITGRRDQELQGSASAEVELLADLDDNPTPTPPGNAAPKPTQNKGTLQDYIATNRQLSGNPGQFTDANGVTWQLHGVPRDIYEQAQDKTPAGLAEFAYQQTVTEKWRKPALFNPTELKAVTDAQGRTVVYGNPESIMDVIIKGFEKSTNFDKAEGDNKRLLYRMREDIKQSMKPLDNRGMVLGTPKIKPDYSVFSNKGPLLLHADKLKEYLEAGKKKKADKDGFSYNIDPTTKYMTYKTTGEEAQRFKHEQAYDLMTQIFAIDNSPDTRKEVYTRAKGSQIQKLRNLQEYLDQKIAERAQYMQNQTAMRQAVNDTVDKAIADEDTEKPSLAENKQFIDLTQNDKPSLLSRIKSWLSGKTADEMVRPLVFKNLTRRYLADLAQGVFIPGEGQHQAGQTTHAEGGLILSDDPADNYNRLAQNMSAEAVKLQTGSDQLFKDWEKIRKLAPDAPALTPGTNADLDTAKQMLKLPDAANWLDVMHEMMNLSTLYHVDPTESQIGEFQDDWLSLYSEQEREDMYENLRRVSAIVPADVIAQYRAVRDTYIQHQEIRSRNLEEMIQRSALSDEAKREAILRTREELEKTFKEGPYFPLYRDGNFTVFLSRPGSRNELHMFQTADEAREFGKNAQAQGWNATVGKKSQIVQELDKVSPAFLQDVFKTLGIDEDMSVDSSDIKAPEADAAKSLSPDEKAQLRDQLYQLYLDHMPDLSVRRHFQHRQGTIGYNRDQMKAAAEFVTHSAKQLAKMKYADIMAKQLDLMRQIKDPVDKVTHQPLPGSVTDGTLATDLHDAFSDHFKHLMSPPDSRVANAIGSAMFAFNFGIAPAAALINTSQTFMFSLPMLGARFGMGKSSKYMGQAIKDFAKFSAPEGAARVGAFLKGAERAGLDFSDSKDLSPDEHAFMKRMIDEGHIDVSMSHDIAGLGQDAQQPGYAEVRDVRQKAMHVVSYFFHRAEVFNRAVTGITAYRLKRDQLMTERAAGKNDLGDIEINQAAQEFSIDETYRTQADYGSSNRPVMWQGNMGRIVTTYKQYVLYVIYTLARDANKALAKMPEGLTQEQQENFKLERRIARRELAGILAAHAAVTGLMGIPSLPMTAAIGAGALAKRHKLAAAAIAGSLATMIPVIIGALDDDDEPFNAENEIRQWIAGTLGQRPAEMITKGLPRGIQDVPGIGGLFAGDLHNRMALSSLLYYDPEAQDFENADAAFNWVTEVVGGPTVGFAKQWIRGLQTMDEGNVYKGMEQIAPVRLVRDLLKAQRYNADDAVLNWRQEPVIDGVRLSDVFAQAMGFTPSRLSEAYEARGVIKGAEQAILNARRNVMDEYWRAFRQGDKDGMKDAWQNIIDYNRRNPDFIITGKSLNQSMKSRMRRSQDNTLGFAVNDKLEGRFMPYAGAYGV